MIKALALEYFKIRRKKVWVMLTLFLVAELVWASLSMSISISRSPENASWEALIFTLSSMNGLFLPIISAIIVSRICDMEHKGSTWKMLMTTSIGRNHVYAAKYMCASSLALYGIVIQAGFIIGFGSLNNFEGPPFKCLCFCNSLPKTLLTNLAITSMQQWLSLAVKNQAFALSLGMLGGFLGTTLTLFPASLRHFFIWSYYMDLSPVTYIYSASSGTYLSGTMRPGLLLAVLFMALVFYICGNFHISRQDV